MESSLTPSRSGLPSPLQLAYIGDAVWELHVRRAVLAEGPSTMDALHRRVVARVQASEQARCWRRIEAGLSDEERDVARRARNAKLTPPRGTSHGDYRQSTSFESVLGFLYWTGRRERLKEVMGLAEGPAQAEGEDA